MSDRLALANAIEDAGIDRVKAERVASVIIDVIHDNVASKQDLQLVETALKADLLALESRLTERFTRRGITGLIAAASILFAALHMWPPHG